MKNVHIVLPNQLFNDLSSVNKEAVVYLVEEDLFFKQYAFHKQKIVLHRASMKKYADFLKKNGYETVYVDSKDECADIRLLMVFLASEGSDSISIFDPTDDWIEKRIKKGVAETGLELKILQSPMWINSREELEGFFKSTKKKFFQTQFYISERKRLGLLLENGDQPKGGKWTYDAENRKKYPKGKVPPIYPKIKSDSFFEEAMMYVEKSFANNPGSVSEEPLYPTDYKSTITHLQLFFEERFSEFGVYEDAIVANHSTLNHSILTPMLNIGLITPKEIIDEAILYSTKNEIPLNSLEGFVRQIIGWREFIRGVYLAKGQQERTTNFWQFKRKIPASFYNGTTGIEPVDITIKKLLESGYNHHIERLMVLGNFMFLCEFDPDEVYKWFMEMYVDSYDWVMVPNVYGMSQFADGGLMSTKPYFSGSNYLNKMSNYGKGDWQPIWDGLFWRFIAGNRDFFLKNPRLSMMVRTWDKMDEFKKSSHLNKAEAYLNQI